MESKLDSTILNSLNQEITPTNPPANDKPAEPTRLTPPPILEKDSHINRRNVLLVLLGIFLFSSVIAALFLTQYFITQYQLQQSQPKPTPTVTTTPTATPDPTANWQIYQSDLYHYEMKFPADWKQIEHSSNFEYITSYRSSDDSYLEIIATKVPADQTLDQYLAQMDQTNATGYEGKPSKKILSTNQTKVDNQPAIKRVEEWLAAGFTTSVTYVKIDYDKLDSYVFSFAAIPSGDNQDGEAFKQYSTILSTFKMLTSPVGVTLSPTATIATSAASPTQKP